VHDLEPKQFARDTHNMAVEYSYEPGSTFKVVTMGAALTAGIVTPQTQFRIPYAIKVGDRVVHDDAPRPTRTFTAAQILQQSSNVGTVTIAELVHKQLLYDWIRRWGFGRRTDIGLPAEAAGAVMPPDKWYSSSIGNIPIGQGISVTPLQMAAMYSGIANGGVMVEPHVVAKIGGRPAPKPVSRRVLSPTVDHTLVNMLKGVVDTAAGTGTRASVPGYTVAGKTGTAQKAENGGYSKTDYVASFVGFFPADDPQVEVMVVVDSPRGNIFGGLVAAPAFQEIGTFLTQALSIRPDQPVRPAG
jgi:cell division protein FtsI (penicillin-binding protein 3)/stage V sporulation protein D (sporulation-specific penicillin-binding protein)